MAPSPTSAGVVVPARRSGSRLRVLTVVDHVTHRGGAERFATGLALHLPRERIEAWICATRESSGSLAAEVDASGLPLVVLGRRAKWDVHRLGGLVALLRRERFDVLHAHKFGSNLWCSLLGRACRVPVVIAQEHSWSYSGDRLRMWIDGQITGRLATRFVAVSQLDAERMVTLEGVPAHKVLWIPTAYIPREHSPDSDIRAELGLAPGTPLVGIAATLRPEKAVSVLVDAHARLLERVPGAHLAVAGDGPCRGELEQQVQTLGSAGQVHFMGVRDDVESIIRSIDVAALSSDREGLPLFALECMANRTPLVATAVGGLKEIITDGVNGLLVPARDPAGLAAALRSLLEDRPRAAALATAAAATMHAYSIDEIAERFTELYFELVAASGA